MDESRITLANIQEQMSKLPMITGRPCGAYICGPETYALLFAILPVACEIGKNPGTLAVLGMRIFEVKDCPEGKFYPADFLEMPPCTMKPRSSEG